MIPVQRYYLTGYNGDKLFGIINFYQYQGQDIYSFLFDFSGDRFAITLQDGCWVYYGGISDYLIPWIQELGRQIEDTNYI